MLEQPETTSEMRSEHRGGQRWVASALFLHRKESSVFDLVSSVPPKSLSSLRLCGMWPPVTCILAQELFTRRNQTHDLEDSISLSTHLLIVLETGQACTETAGFPRNPSRPPTSPPPRHPAPPLPTLLQSAATSFPPTCPAVLPQARPNRNHSLQHTPSLNLCYLTIT